MNIELEKSDVMNRLLQSIVKVISRRSSEDYALVMVGNTIKKLQDKYDFLNYIDIKATRYSEIENIVTIDSSINTVEPEEIGKAIQEIVGIIVTAMGKNAGFFFIKEVKNKIGPNYGLIIRDMGVDFDFMQFSFEVDKKQTRTTIPQKFVSEFDVESGDKMEWSNAKGKLKGELKKNE